MLTPKQIDAIKRRLPSFDLDACAFLFSAEQSAHVGGLNLGVQLANGAVWFPDPFNRPLDEKGRPVKVRSMPGAPRLLLIGPGVESSDEVILVEGEGHGAALASNGFANVVVAGGTKNLLSADGVEARRRLLQGKRVRVWFDGDTEGREGASKVARHLLEERAATGVLSVSIVKPPRGWPAGADILDFVATFSPDEPQTQRMGRLLGPLSEVVGTFHRAADVPDPDAAASAGSVLHDANERPRVRLLTQEEFMAAEAPEAIVEEFIYERSSHMLNGASKAGKSVLAEQLAMCVAAGKPFLGLSVKQNRVLLVSLEMNAGAVRRRMESISRDAGIPMPEAPQWFAIVAPTVGETPQIDLTDERGVADLRRLIAESGARLVVLDTLYRFIPGVDPSDNGQMGEVMGTLNSIASDTGAAILVIHHTRKGQGDDGPVSHSGLGAQIIGGAANVILALHRTSKQDGGRWKLEVEGHYQTPDGPIFYRRPQRDDGTIGAGCVECAASDARDVTREDLERFFEEHGERVSDGVYFFRSRNALESAIVSGQLARSDGAAGALVHDLVTDYAGRQLVVLSGAGPRGANYFVWRGAQPVQPEVVSGELRLLSGADYAQTVRDAINASSGQDAGI